jgi:hypothetical protein
MIYFGRNDGMNTEKIVKESQAIMLVTLIIGIVLLGTGIMFSLMEINFIPNNKALIGLSFIPLTMAFTYYVKLLTIKKSPQKMKTMIINENDERLVGIRNEGDAKAFKSIQGALFLAYMGYTFMVPKDIFESVGWWILLILLFMSFILQGIFFKIIMGRYNPKDEG